MNENRWKVLFIVLTALIFPGSVSAYVFVGDGRLVRMDVLMVWDGEEQVLALLPQFISVEEKGLLVIPVPPGTKNIIAPDPEMFSLFDSPSHGEKEEDQENNDDVHDKDEKIPDKKEGSSVEAGESSEKIETQKKGGQIEKGPDFRVVKGRPMPHLKKGQGGIRPLGRISTDSPDDDDDDDEKEEAYKGLRKTYAGRKSLDIEKGRTRIEPLRPKGKRTVSGPSPSFPGKRAVIKGDFRKSLDRTRMISAIRLREASLVRPTRAPQIFPADKAMQELEAALGENFYKISSEITEEYINKGWTFAVVEVPRSETRMRLGPIAFSMKAEKPVLPLRMSSIMNPQSIGIRFVSGMEIEIPHELEQSFGLRYIQRATPVDNALMAWINASGFTGYSEWMVYGLVTGPLNSQRFPLSDIKEDLYIPVILPPSSEEETVEEKVAVKGRKKKKSSGCNCAAFSHESFDSGNQGRSGTFILWSGLIILFLLLRRKPSPGFKIISGHSGFFLTAVFSLSAFPYELKADSGVPGDAPDAKIEFLETDSGREKIHSGRVLVYPKATESGISLPSLSLSNSGVPLALYFPDQNLDLRPGVHYVTLPDFITLSVAERTAFIQAEKNAKPGMESVVTITMEGGRPLSFRVDIVGKGSRADAAVEVRTGNDGKSGYMAELAGLRDELAECRDNSKERSVKLIAALLLEAPLRESAVEYRRLRKRDKQHRIYVDVMDAFRLFDHTYIRISIENRDGSGRIWVAGEPSLTVVGHGQERMPLQLVSVSDNRIVERGESIFLVISFRTPQIPSGSKTRLVLHEDEGQRHIVIDNLKL